MNYESLSDDRLLVMAKDGDRQAENQFIINNLGLAKKCANQWLNTIGDFDELFSICQFALWRAYQDFELERGYKFSTLAFKYMRLDIYKYLDRYKEKKRNPEELKKHTLIIGGTRVKCKSSGKYLNLPHSNKESKYIHNIMIKDVKDTFIKAASKKQITVYKEIVINDRKQQEVAEDMNVTRQAIQLTMRRNKQLLKDIAKQYELIS